MKGKPGIAAFLSAVFPGLGQWYNGERLKGVGFFTAAGILLVWAGTSLPSEDSLLQALERGEPVDGMGRIAVILVVVLVIACWSIVDAWRSGARLQRNAPRSTR